MSDIDEQIAEAERMQRWGYVDQLKRQKEGEFLYVPEEASPPPNDVHDLENIEPVIVGDSLEDLAKLEIEPDGHIVIHEGIGEQDSAPADDPASQAEEDQ